ncbi:MAG: S1C family serine protease [Phycisphaerae bacterium]
MKVALLTLLLPFVPFGAGSAEGFGGDPSDRAGAATVVFDGGPTEMRVVASLEECDSPDGPVVIMVTGDTDPAGHGMRVMTSGDGDARQIVVKGIGGASDGAYLGVSIGEVPEVLAAQFDISGRGVLVLNVVDDSAADDAGIQRHDVIMSIGGEPVDADPSSLVKLIQAHKPGDDVTITILREGKERSVTAKLGSRKEAGELAWKFEFSPDAEIEERVMTRGRMMMKDADGHWIIKDLGDLHDEFRSLLPESGLFTTKVFVDGAKKSVSITVERDGETIAIKREDDGKIVVTRTDADGDTRTTTYDNEDDLKADDEEAYDLLRHSNTYRVEVGVGSLGDIDVDIDSLRDELNTFKIELKNRLHGAGAGVEDAMERLEHLKLFDGRHGFKWRSADDDEDDAVPEVDTPHGGKPVYTFEAHADGSIEAHIRKGDAELVRHYKDAADLSARAPGLFARYKALADFDEEME